MAGATTTDLAFIILTTLLLLFLSATNSNSEEFSRKLSKSEMKMKRQKLSHLHFYYHDIVSGRSPTAMRVAQASTTNSSATEFGLLEMMDDPLTVGPDTSSKIVGRAQGMYGSADLSDFGFLMAFNFVFLDGKFNGSTLSVLGRNKLFSAVREMPIVRGSGVFRFARGYAQARTHRLDLKTKNDVVEFNVYVLHY